MEVSEFSHGQSRGLATARSQTQSSDGTSASNSHRTPKSSKSVAWRKKETNEAANDAKTTRSWSRSGGRNGRSQVTTALLCQMSPSLRLQQTDFRHVGEGGALLVGLMVTFFPICLVFLKEAAPGVHRV